MLAVISPAKRLDWAKTPGRVMTEPGFLRDANALSRQARQLSVEDLRGLMAISEDLARLNHARFAAFKARPAPETLRPAALAFAGDTYIGLQARGFTEPEMDWAQGRLRILSGLYGLLRPLDAIQPYRLEMGSRLATERGATLYDWWGKRIARALNATAQEVGTDVLVNCASAEYFGAVDRKALKLRVVTPVFLEERGGARVVVSFWAKQARGAMARFIVRNRLTSPEALKDFGHGGYVHMPELSEGDRWVFLRNAADERVA